MSTPRSSGSTRTMAFSPPSVIHGAPSGPTMTPWGREPAPSGVCRVSPVSGLSHPSSPDPCAVYHTPPSRAGATSWGRDPAGIGNACNRGLAGVSLLKADGAGGAFASLVGPSVESAGGVEAGGFMDGVFVIGGAGAEVGADAVVESGADSIVGLADPLHPASANRINVPIKSGARGPQVRVAWYFLRVN